VKLLILLAATLFGLAAFAAGASASCRTGKVTLLASSEAEVMENAQSVGSITPKARA
jgi:hypothetical protein